MPRSAATCAIGRSLSSASRTPRSISSFGYLLGLDMTAENLLSLGQHPGIEVSVETGLAQRTGYRPGQVLQLDWAEMPTRPIVAGRERRVYALIAALPYSGAQTAHFCFDMTIESFLEGHVRAFSFLGGVVRECVYDNLRSVVARRDGRELVWNQR